MSYFVTHCLTGDFKSISRSAENLFRCGHVQHIKVAADDEHVFIKSVCLPEMRKDRVYHIHTCLSKIGYDILNAECGCLAGSGPCASCKHIGALAYALTDFFQIKYASDGLPTCTDCLQQWNCPRGRKIEPIPVEHLGDRRRELMMPSKIRSQMIYARQPQYREIDHDAALENLRCDLVSVNKPCALLNVLVPQLDKIHLDDTYCMAKPTAVNYKETVAFCDPNEIPKVVAYEELTAEGILGKLSITKSLGGHNGISFIFKYRKFIHVQIILLTVDWEILNWKAKSCSINPRRRRTKVRNISSMGAKILDDIALLHLRHFEWPD